MEAVDVVVGLPSLKPLFAFCGDASDNQLHLEISSLNQVDQSHV